MRLPGLGNRGSPSAGAIAKGGGKTGCMRSQQDNRERREPKLLPRRRFPYATLPEACKCRTCSHHGHGCRQCQSDPYTHVLFSSIFAELRSRAEAALKKYTAPTMRQLGDGG